MQKIWGCGEMTKGQKIFLIPAHWEVSQFSKNNPEFPTSPKLF